MLIFSLSRTTSKNFQHQRNLLTFEWNARSDQRQFGGVDFGARGLDGFDLFFVLSDLVSVDRGFSRNLQRQHIIWTEAVLDFLTWVTLQAFNDFELKWEWVRKQITSTGEAKEHEKKNKEETHMSTMKKAQPIPVELSKGCDHFSRCVRWPRWREVRIPAHLAGVWWRTQRDLCRLGNGTSTVGCPVSKLRHLHPCRYRGRNNRPIEGLERGNVLVIQWIGT